MEPKLNLFSVMPKKESVAEVQEPKITVEEIWNLCVWYWSLIIPKPTSEEVARKATEKVTNELGGPELMNSYDLRHQALLIMLEELQKQLELHPEMPELQTLLSTYDHFTTEMNAAKDSETE